MTPKVVAPGVVEAVRETGTEGYGLLMRAENVRDRYGTGAHADVSLWGVTPTRETQSFLASDIFNIGRGGDATKLLNTARRRAGDQVALVMGSDTEKFLVERDFNLFCRSVSPTLMEVNPAKLVAGDSSIPIEFRASPHVLMKGGTVSFGDPGSCKSWLELIRAVCIDAGKNGFWEIEQTNVLYINLERDEDSLARRLGWVNECLGLPPDRPLAMLNARGRGFLAVRPQVEKIMRERDIGFLVLDSISRADTGDLNQIGPATDVMNMLISLTPSWVAIGHMGHADKTRIMGNTALLAAPDVMLRVTSERKRLPDGGTDVGTKFKMTKANDIEFPPDQTLTLGFRPDNKGLRSIKLSDANHWPTLASGGDQDSSLRRRLVKLLTSEGAMIVQEIAVALDERENQIRARLTEGKGRDFLLLNPDEKEGQRWGVLQRST